MLQSFLFRIKDRRRRQGQRYQVGHILLLAILAILSGATSYRKIHAFIQAQYQTLNELFAPNWKRRPAHTTIRAIIQGTSSAEMEVEIAKKTNEIPTAQELISQLGLAGCIFTFDAINCQEKTLDAAKATGNEIVVQMKDNQPTLQHDCQQTAETLRPAKVYQVPLTKSHNRIESRKAQVFTQPSRTDADKWSLVEAIIKVERKRQVFDTRAKCWQRSDETSFYISTTVLSAEEFCKGIRAHWGIENREHCVRDVTLGEAKSRIRTNPHIFAKLRSFALNILRANHVENVSLELFNNCMNLGNVLNYVGVMEN